MIGREHRWPKRYSSPDGGSGSVASWNRRSGARDLRQRVVLATASFRDLISYPTEIVEPDRIAIHHRPDRPLINAHPFEVARWTREGRITLS